MVIEYQIKRVDVVNAYFYNLRHSSRTQLIVLGFAIFAGVQYLIIRNPSNSSLSIYDYITALIFAIAAILLLPAISFVLAKTQKRVLSIINMGLKLALALKKERFLGLLLKV